MPKTIYYWESEDSCGEFVAESDVLAIHTANSIENLMIVYKESETGKPPFPVVLEKTKEEREAKKEMKRLNYLFHNLWTRDVGTEGYDKQKWLELSRLLSKKGITTI